MNKINRILLAVALLCLIGIQCFSKNFLSTDGNKLIDANGNVVRLTGVNWFGFETNLAQPHGIWCRDNKSMLQQIKDQGFNCIRFPFSNKIFDPEVTFKLNASGTDPYTGVSPMNLEESEISTPLELMDIIVEWCQENNMKIIFDNHSRQPDGYMNEKVWYTKKTSEEKWIEDWVSLAERYKDYDAVIGMDLNNEPHDEATWGNSNPATDWNMAAEKCGNAILEVNPNVLILVEGVEAAEGGNYWWGGNLKGVRNYPIQLTHPDKLVYSPHEYGPTVYNQEWFSDPTFPANMPGIWNEYFHYIYEEEISPLLIGEFGIKANNGVDAVWFDTFLKFMGNRYSWTFWCWNPNSGDTGGILGDQWTSVIDWKMDKLRPYLAPEIPNGDGTVISQHKPIASISATPTEGTTPALILVDGSGSTDADGDVLTYDWNFGDGTSANTVSTSHVYDEAGIYNITLTVSDGIFTCTEVIVIIIHPEEGSGSNCHEPEEISIPMKQDGAGEFCWVTEDPIGIITSWNLEVLDINGVDFSNVWANEFPEPVNGKYYIHYKGVHSWSHFEANSLKGATESSIFESKNTGTSIYPNPFKEAITISLDDRKGIKEITITDQSGRLVEKVKLPTTNNTIQVGHKLAKGLYILKIETQENTKFYKIKKN